MAEVDYPRPNIEILKKEPKAFSMFRVIGLLIPILIIFSIVAYPVHAGGGPPSKMYCLSNVKRVVLGTLLYAGDHDDHLPLAYNWTDSSIPYLKSEDLIREKATEFDHRYAYAYRRKASGLDESKVPSPPEYALVFDSVLNHRNAFSELDSLPKPGRHGGSNCIGFADGHAKAIRVAAHGGDDRQPKADLR